MEAIQKNPLLLVVIIVIGWILFNKNGTGKETFTGRKPVSTMDQYTDEIRAVAAYVGPYIGDLYLYLRAKYYDPVLGKALPPQFMPGSVNDPTLSDSLLPIARAQIKAWIDSSRLHIGQRYEVADLLKWQKFADLSYKELPNKVLQVFYTEFGKTTTYLV